MRWFAQKNFNGGPGGVFNQYYQSKICDDILIIISEESNVKGNIYGFIESYLNSKNKHFKTFEKEYENQFDDYRDNNVEEK